MDQLMYQDVFLVIPKKVPTTVEFVLDHGNTVLGRRPYR